MSADSIEKIADERALFEQHAPKLHADWFQFDSETNTYVEPVCHAQWMGWQFARALPSLAELERDAGRWRKIEQLWFLGEVELTTDEDGHFMINADPAEHKAQTWTGIDQGAAVDAVFADARAKEGKR